MSAAFQFDDGGRTYSCRVEKPRSGRTEAWWWFTVSGDQQRYAPFRAEADDTEATVRRRVLAYYAELLERRGRPAEARSHWARRPKPAAPAAGGEQPATERTA